MTNTPAVSHSTRKRNLGGQTAQGVLICFGWWNNGPGLNGWINKVREGNISATMEVRPPFVPRQRAPHSFDASLDQLLDPGWIAQP